MAWETALGEVTHALDRVEEVLVLWRLVAGERHELGDVHALIADPLEAAGDVHQRGNEPQVAGDRRLTREQRQDALLNVKAAPFDPVPIGDGHSRQLDVLVFDRFQRSVERLAHHLSPPRAWRSSSIRSSRNWWRVSWIHETVLTPRVVF